MTTDLDAIERRHRQEVRGVNCRECRVSWPCDASVLLSQLREARAEREAAQRLATTLRKTLDRQREETVKGSERADRAESQFQEARERLRLANIDVFNTEAEVASLTAIRERAEAARAVHAKSPTFTSGLIVLVLDDILGAAPSPEPRPEECWDDGEIDARDMEEQTP